jgi:hypothetical protein
MESANGVAPGLAESIHNIPIALRLEGKLNEEALAGALGDVAERLAVAAAAGFDLEREIPLRAWLFRLSAERHVLLLVLHHIAGDAWSLSPLAQDIGEAYAARRNGQTPSWTELPVQYADYTLWQRQLLGDESDGDSVAARQLRFWRDALAGVPEDLKLPFEHGRPGMVRCVGGTVKVPSEEHPTSKQTSVTLRSPRRSSAIARSMRRVMT